MYDMYNEYENQLEILKEQVQELQNLMDQYEKLNDEKDQRINQLKKENLFLKNQFKKVLEEKNHQQLKSKPEINKNNIPVPEIRRPKIVQKPVEVRGFTRPPPSPPPSHSNSIPQPPNNIKVSLQPSQNSSGNPAQTLKVNQAPNYSNQDNYNPPQGSQVGSGLQQTHSTGVLKRICPKCGAMGFAIKEVEDKTQIISYVPRRMYKKKKICTKCRLEF